MGAQSKCLLEMLGNGFYLPFHPKTVLLSVRINKRGARSAEKQITAVYGGVKKYFCSTEVKVQPPHWGKYFISHRPAVKIQ